MKESICRYSIHLAKYIMYLGLISVFPNNGMSATNICATESNGIRIDSVLTDTLRTDTLKTIELSEVVVKSQPKIHKLESEVYIPTTLQKRVSIDGYDLLRNMAIPQIDIDAVSNETKSLGKIVTFIVDGHIVTNLNDIKQISPRDILKVEYNGMPTGEYVQCDCIIAFTTRRRNSGSNIMVGGMQSLNKRRGDYNSVIRFFRQHNEHSLAYSDSYSHDDSHISQTEHFIYPNGDKLEKDISSNTSVYKNRNQNLFYNFHYYGDSVTFNVRVGYLFRQPRSETDYQTNYKGSFNKTINSFERSDETSYSPYLSFSSKFILGKGQKINFRGSLDYSNNRYDYLLREGIAENVNYTKEHYYRLVFGSNYTKMMHRNWAITGALYNYTQISHTNYLLNQSPIKGGLTYSEFLYELGISKQWTKIYASLDGGISQLLYKMEGQERKICFSPRISATLKYTLLPHFYIQYKGNVVNSAPTMSMFNNIEQNIDMIQKRRGNPNMKVTTIVSNIMNINYDIANWSFYAMYDMFISWKNNGEFVVFDNGYFVHSYLTEGHYHYTNPEIGMSYANNGFLLKTKFGAEHYQVTGKNGITDTEWYNKSSVSYAVKSLNVNLFYTTYRHGVYATLEQWSNSAQYGMTVSYKYKNVSMLAGVQNPFTHYQINKSLLNQSYNKYRNSFDNLRGKYLFIKLSCSLNFGNKKHTYTDVNTDKNINSAIMKSGISN